MWGFFPSISLTLSLPLCSASPPTGFLSAAAATRPSATELRNRRNAVFSREQARQRALYPRIEKIEVSLQGPGLDGTVLVMNKGMSTALSCARRKPSHKAATLCSPNLCFFSVMLNTFVYSSRPDGAPRQQLGPGLGGWGSVLAPPAPNPLLHPHAAHVQGQRPHTGKPGTPANCSGG